MKGKIFTVLGILFLIVLGCIPEESSKYGFLIFIIAILIAVIIAFVLTSKDIPE